MAARFVNTDRCRRIAFSPAGSTIVLVNQDAATDVYIAGTEEELLNAYGSIVNGGNLNLGIVGTKLSANGGQLNWTNYKGELWGIASGFATPSGGGAPVAGSASTYIRVLPG